MLAVIEGSKEEDGIERTDSLEDIKRGYSHLVNCDPYQDMLFAEVEGQVVGYNRLTWRVESQGDYIYTNFGFLLPEWRRKGIGSVMQQRSENRLCEIAEAHPFEATKWFESYAADTEIGAQRLLETRGYKPVRYSFEMVRRPLDNLPEALIPPGVEVREVSRKHARMIWEALDEAFKDHWGYSPHKEEHYQDWLETPTFDPSLWKVAWAEDQVAGMVLNYIDHAENEEYGRLRGYTEDICVVKPWRRKGLARHLIVESIKLHRELGMEEVALGVDTQNLTGALRLYQSVGYREVKRFTTYRMAMLC
jgi:GNAT superfamily N-acetyltransferase